MTAARINDYHAPKPRYPAAYWVRYVLWRVLLPPILLWDAAQYLVTRFFGKTLGMLVVPAQLLPPGRSAADSITELLRLPRVAQNLTFAQLRVHTYDGAALDTLLIQPMQSCAFYLVNLGTNGSSFPELLQNSNAAALPSMIKLALELPANIVLFNYRNVGASTKPITMMADLLTDARAQVDRLLALGIKPQHIVLHGRSIGGAVATALAKEYFDAGIMLNHFNIFSFASVTAAVQAKLFPQTSWWGKLAWPGLKLFFALNRFELAVTTAYQALPANNKEYVVIRSKKIDRLMGLGADDQTIQHAASLHMGLKAGRRREKQAIDVALAQWRARANALTPTSLPIAEGKCVELMALRRQYKKRKLKPLINVADGHNYPLAFFSSQDQPALSGADVFTQFFAQVTKNAAPATWEQTRQHALDKLTQPRVRRHSI